MIKTYRLSKKKEKIWHMFTDDVLIQVSVGESTSCY